MDLAELKEEWYYNEDTDDPNIYEFLRNGNTSNIFQMWKFTPTRMIKDFKVKDIGGLTAVNAGNRPGPLAKGADGKSLVDRFTLAVKTGIVEKLDSRIDYILAPTNGQLWYQEQLMELGMIMAGYSLGDADLRIRKVIAKKLRDKIPEVRNEFIYGKKSIYKYDEKEKKNVYVSISEENSPLCIGSVKNGFDEALAIKIFDQMEAFASYAFNKSHSAAYALVGYKTAWLSYYYPVEWSVACLTLDSMDGKSDKIIATLNSCKKRGVKLLPPDINTSTIDFTVAKLPNGEKAIRFGLLGIKDVGVNISNMVSKLIEFDGEFKSFEDFLQRTVGSNNSSLRKICLSEGKYSIKEKDGKKVKTLKNPFSKRNIVPLIFCGAFDELDENRHRLFNYYIAFKKDKDELLDEDNYGIKEKLAYELELLGYYVSQHPLDGEAFPYIDLDTAFDGQSVQVAGILKSCDTAKTKKGDKYYKIKIELKDGRITNVNVFKNTYTVHPECVQGLTGKRAKEGKEILIVSGKYSSQFNNINATNILKIRGAEDLTNDKEVVSDGIQQLTLEPRKNPMDEELMYKVD